MNRTVCFIPVREGSKRIPGKNLKLLGNKPLICWILDTVLASEIADETWVATNSDDMERLIGSRYAGRVKVYRRSQWSARDEAPTMEVVKEFMESVAPHDLDRFILLQATSPFTRREELRTLLDEMRKGEHDSFVSCCRLKKFRWSSDGCPLDYSFDKKPRTQEYEGMLLESGAFYASTVGKIRKSGMLLPGRVRVMETDGAGLIDIDDYADWRQAEDYARHIGMTDDHVPQKPLPDIPAVSVIVPVYNGEDYLDSCLSSLSRQFLKGMEVILVNDGSTDSSSRILQAYAAEHTNFLYVEQANGGLSAARNRGLEYAKGRYIAFLDCDDFLPQNALLSLYKKALAMDADIVAGNVAVFDNGRTSDFLRKNADSGSVVSGETFLWRVMNEGRYVPMVYCYLYRRIFVEQHRLRFEPGILHEDELWTPIALTKAAKVASIGSVTYYYRQHGASIMKTACAEKRVSSLTCIINALQEFTMNSGLSEGSKQTIYKRIEVLKRIMNSLIDLKCHANRNTLKTNN